MDNNTTKARIQLSKRQQRALNALKSHDSSGVWSFDLRQAAGVMNVSDTVCQLRTKGYRIECRLQDYTDRDGRVVQVGRYFLE